MKIREINEGLGDVGAAIGSGLYKATGGMIGSKQAAIERGFISNFNSQLARSARTGGPAFDMEDYLNAYAQQLGWPLSEKEKMYIKQLSDQATAKKYSSGSITPIGRLMYSLADKYRRIQPAGGYTRGTTTKTKSAGGATGGATGGTTTPAAPAAPAASTSPSPAAAPAASTSPRTTGAKILNALMRVYKEPTGKTDLEQIMRDSAYLLSRLDKSRYNTTVRDLATGGAFAAGVKGSATTAQSSAPPSAPKPEQTVPSDINQAMPGFSKASDDLEHKMKPGGPVPSSAERAYRPGSRKPGVTDVSPKVRK